MPTICLKIPEELDARLKVAASKKGVSRSTLVRDAVEAYFETAGRRQGSAADLADGLIGCLEGPRDLSYNPRHLRGLGQ